MDQNGFLISSYIPLFASEYNIPEEIIRAICAVESNYQPLACRYEPAFQWIWQVDHYAGLLVQSRDTELIQQKTSWGPAQIMGSTARQMGFDGYLTDLSTWHHGLRYAVKYMAHLKQRFPQGYDWVAAYNAGSPRRKADGTYVNQGYVDRVISKLPQASTPVLG